MTITRERRQDWDLIKLAGEMTEESGVQLLMLYDDATKKCIFNMAGVTDINSNGVRAWIVFFRDFRQEREIEFEACSPVIVAQMNMMRSFSQKARVRSVLAPFMCNTCRLEIAVLIEERDFPPPGSLPRAPRCKSCGGAAEFQDVGFFDFLHDSVS